MLRWIVSLLLHAPSGEANAVSLRRWFAAFVTYLSVLAALALLGFHRYDQAGSEIALRGAMLALYLFYLSLCCTFFPAPTTWIILLLASPVVGLVPTETVRGVFGVTGPWDEWIAGVATVVFVAALGAFGTAMANLNEYHVFTWLLRFGRVHKVRHHRLYQKAEAWFETSPFLLIALFSLLPVPVDVVRWLAIGKQYSRRRFALANWVGRFLRYALLAAAATSLGLGIVEIVVVQLAFGVVVLVRAWPRLRAWRRQRREQKPLTEPWEKADRTLTQEAEGVST